MIQLFQEKKQTMLRSIVTVITVIQLYVTGVNAENDGISWPSVGIAWLFCVFTFVSVIISFILIKKLIKRRLKANQQSLHGRLDSQRSDHSCSTHRTLLSSSSSTALTSGRNSFQKPLTASKTRNSGLSAASSGVPSAMYQQLHVDTDMMQHDPSNSRYLPRSVSQEPERINRRKSDFTSKWCTERQLSENTAHILRKNGFISEITLSSLRPNDVASLGLMSRAEECVLRNMLEEMFSTRVIEEDGDRMEKGRKYHRGSNTSTNSRGYIKKKLGLSSSADFQLSETSSTHPDVSTGLLDRAYSESEMDDTDLKQLAGLRKSSSRTTAYSYDVIDGDKSGMFGTQSSIDLQEGPSTSELTHKGASNVKGFNGLLSDKGLHTLASQIGVEWQHLGAYLNIPTPLLQQIKMDHISSTHNQIYEMLRLFRDTTSGSKEEVKGKLQVALENIDRRDLANALLKEQVDGSVERIPYHSIV